MSTSAEWENQVLRIVTELAPPEGISLTPLETSLLTLGLASAVTVMDEQQVSDSILEALCCGATPTQIQEVVSVVAGLGVHSLMITAVKIHEHARSAGFEIADELTSEQQVLWDTYVGEDPFWQSMEAELPGFLKAMLRLSPAQFEAFFQFCAVPWTTRTVSARLKELLAMASDAMPTHRFLPGFRLHLRNAVKFGYGRTEINQALQIAEQIRPREL